MQVGTFQTPLQDGWGITTRGKLLVLSDGSSRLTWVDPAQGFKAVKSVVVKDGTRSIGYLNEVGMVALHVYRASGAARLSSWDKHDYLRPNTEKLVVTRTAGVQLAPSPALPTETRSCCCHCSWNTSMERSGPTSGKQSALPASALTVGR